MFIAILKPLFDSILILAGMFFVAIAFSKKYARIELYAILMFVVIGFFYLGHLESIGML